MSGILSPPDSMRILYIDDGPNNREIVKLSLEGIDPEMDIVSAASPTESLRMMEELQIDCIVCDYGMPEMNGIELCRRIRETSDVPFIIYTGRGSEEVASVAFDAGADDYLRKEPGSGHFTVLAKRVRQAIEKHRVEGLYRRVLEHSVDGIGIVEGTKIVYANQALAELDGVSDPSELIGRDALDFVLAEDHVRLKSIGLDRRKGERSPSKYEYSLLRPDGVVRRVEVSASPILYEGIPASLGIVRDVTDRVRYENRLEALHEYVNSFSEAQNEEEVYTLTIEAMDKALGFEITDILMVDGEVLRHVASKENNPKGFELRLDGLGNTVLSLRESRSIYVPDVEKNKNYAYALDPKTGERYKGQPLSMSELCSPIILGGEAIGVLNVESTRRNAFTDEDIKILEIFARHVAHAIFRLRQENEIRASEENYRTLLEFSADSVLVMNGSTIVYANQKAAETVGLSSPSELINCDGLDFIHPDDRDGVTQNIIMRQQGEATPAMYEIKMLHVDGSSVDVEVNTYLGDFEDIPATISFARDVSEKVRNRERLAALHNCTIRLASADSVEGVASQTFESLEEVFDLRWGNFVIVEEGRLISVYNKGLTYGQFEVLSIDGPGVIARAARTGETQLVSDTRNDEDYISTLLDEGSQTLSELAVPIKDNGNVIGIINLESPVVDGFSSDDAKLIELYSQYVASAILRLRKDGLLRASEKKYRNILESSLDGVAVILDDELLYVNERFAEMHGYEDRSEIMGVSAWDLFDPADHDLIRQGSAKRVEGIKNPPRYELKCVRKDGSKFIVESQTSIVDFEGEEAVLAFHRDVTESRRLREESKRNEELLTGFMDSATDGFSIFDSDLNFLNVNKALEASSGHSKEHFIGKNILDVLPGLKETGRIERYRDVIETGNPAIIEGEHASEDDQYVSIKAFKVGDGLGVIIRDITEHKRLETDLVESEARWRSLVELAPDGIVTLNPLGFVTSINDVFLELTGYSKDEIVGKHFTKLGTIRARDMPTYMKLFDALLKGKTPPPHDFEYQRKDSSMGWGQAHMRSIKVGDKSRETLMILREITERKRLEEELRKSEERYRSLIELAPEGIMTLNLKGEVTSINTAYMKLTGYSENEILGKHFTKLGTAVSLKDMPKYFKMFTAMLRGKTPPLVEFDYKRKDGTLCRGEAISQIVEVEPGKREVLTIHRDITDRTRMEEELRTHSGRLEELISERTSELRESEERFRNVIDNLPMGVRMYKIDAHGDLHLVAANPLADEMLSIPSSAYIGKTIYEVFPHLSDTEIPGRFKEIAEKGGFWHKEDIRYEGDRISNASDNFGFQTAPGEMASVFRDVTEQKRMEEALKASEAKYRSFLEEGLDGVVVTWNGEYLYVNQRYAEMLGYSDSSELLGRNTREVIDPRDAERLDAIIEQRQSGDMQRLLYEVRSLKKDGSSIWVGVASSGIEFEGKQAVITYARDITERKQMEESLLTAERLAVVGRISAMMGHDLRGPLVVIRNAVDLARKKPERTDKVLDMIERNAGHAMDILEDLRTRTREDPVSLAPLELGELLRKATENILLPDGVELRLEIDDTLPELVLDEAKTIRVLDNVIGNAFDAMPAGGVLKIGATREGDKVVIRISDTGPGIPEDTLRNLFEPFYTTKPGGLGLGLTSTKRMVEVQGGTISVETSDGEGATFVIVLPLKGENPG